MKCVLVGIKKTGISSHIPSEGIGFIPALVNCRTFGDNIFIMEQGQGGKHVFVCNSEGEIIKSISTSLNDLPFLNRLRAFREVRKRVEVYEHQFVRKLLDLALDARGNLYICDWNTRFIFRFTSAGKFDGIIELPCQAIRDLAVDSQGNLCALCRTLAESVYQGLRTSIPLEELQVGEGDKFICKCKCDGEITSVFPLEEGGSGEHAEVILEVDGQIESAHVPSDAPAEGMVCTDSKDAVFYVSPWRYRVTRYDESGNLTLYLTRDMQWRFSISGQSYYRHYYTEWIGDISDYFLIYFAQYEKGFHHEIDVFDSRGLFIEAMELEPFNVRGMRVGSEGNVYFGDLDYTSGELRLRKYFIDFSA